MTPENLAGAIIILTLCFAVWVVVSISRRNASVARHYKELEAEIATKRERINQAIEDNAPKVKQPKEAA